MKSLLRKKVLEEAEGCRAPGLLKRGLPLTGREKNLEKEVGEVELFEIE